MNVEIAERLAARRKLAGLSQEALAEKLGVSRQAVSKWERSESSPDTDNLIALAKLYGVSLDELLYVDDAIADDVAFEAADRADARQGAAAPNDSHGTVEVEGIDFEKEGRGRVRVSPAAIHVEDGKDSVHVSWRDGVHVLDRNGEEVHVGWDGVRVRSSNPELVDHIGKHGWHLDEEGKARAAAWLKFPFWALVIVAYLVLGMLSGASWGMGLFLLFLIPVYYLVGAAVASRRVAPMLCGLYPIGATAWFFWMAFIVGQWHPAWVIFLTIPLVEVLIVKTSEWWHRRRGEEAADAEVVAESEQ